MSESTHILLNALHFYARKPEQCRNRAFPDMPGNPNDWVAEVCYDSGDTARDAIRAFEIDEAKRLVVAKSCEE